MSVTFPRGFRASGVACGLKLSGKKDLALIQNIGQIKSAAAVFTTNRCQANPILWSREAIKGGEISAIVLNSGGANCYTGPQGFQTTHLTAEQVASQLGISAAEVLVCSTGLIGEQLDRQKLLSGVSAAAAVLSEEGGESASLAIMTTDSVPKRAQRESKAGWRIGGMAKGAGMLAPGLATMLVVITTDANLQSAELDQALRNATRVSFDRLDSDGCMSTNDQVTLLASGVSTRPDLGEFQQLLTEVCQELAPKLLDDAEGASHTIHISVVNAFSEADAVEVGRSIARNNLFKAAIFGNDPNWGRILAAVGTTRAQFDPYDIDVKINGVLVSSKGQPATNRSEVDLLPRRVDIEVSLNAGSFEATVVTNDLTHRYVEENSAYSS